MDQVSKIITLIGAVIGVASAIGILMGINKLREGLSSDDTRGVNHGVVMIVINGAMLAAAAGLAAYAINQLGSIHF